MLQATTSWLSSAPLRAAASGAFASLLVHYKAIVVVLAVDVVKQGSLNATHFGRGTLPY